MPFDRVKADLVLEQLEAGISLRKSASSLDLAPSMILRWANGSDPDALASGFVEQYARSRALGYHLLGEEILEISDEEPVITITTPGADGAEPDVERRYDAVGVARNRLRVDSRKWMLSKMLPKVYGDKVDISHQGEIGIRRIERVIKTLEPKE